MSVCAEYVEPADVLRRLIYEGVRHVKCDRLRAICTTSWVVSCALAHPPDDSGWVVLALDYVVAAGHPRVSGEGAGVGEPDVVLERSEKREAAS